MEKLIKLQKRPPKKALQLYYGLNAGVNPMLEWWDGKISGYCYIRVKLN